MDLYYIHVEWGFRNTEIEIYNESKHGILYRAFRDDMNMDSDKWVAGVDYSASATCATCHMSAGGSEGKTHNVGDRISWTLRPPISKKINQVRLENGQEFDVPEGQKVPRWVPRPKVQR
ncbi:MAG: hypothetical protein GY807_10845 [Gammaproteobacteria bacterium]|nr:hypothetical protein [Gammaproteobacteria bacterium]